MSSTLLERPVNKGSFIEDGDVIGITYKPYDRVRPTIIYEYYKSTKNAFSAYKVVPKTATPVKNPLNIQKAVYTQITTQGMKGNSVLTNNMSSLTIGADPEILVTDKDGKVIPFGTLYKDNVPGVIIDGFAAEFTPVYDYCLAYLTDKLQDCLNNAYKYVSDKKGAQFSVQDYILTPKKWRYTLPESQVVLGCKPSCNAYGDTVKFKDGIDTPYRTAGCHMHYGSITTYTTKILQDPTAITEIIKWCDIIAGVWSVALLPQQNPRRRKLYGRAGEYRTTYYSSTKSVGLEYRTHSSYVLAHPAIWHLMYEITRSAFILGMSGAGEFIRDLFPSDTTIKNIINKVDVKAAQALVKTHKDFYKATLRHLGVYAQNLAYNLSQMDKGLQNAVDFTNIPANWKLTPLGVTSSWAGHSGSKNCNWTSFSNNFPDQTLTREL